MPQVDQTLCLVCVVARFFCHLNGAFQHLPRIGVFVQVIVKQAQTRQHRGFLGAFPHFGIGIQRRFQVDTRLFVTPGVQVDAAQGFIGLSLVAFIAGPVVYADGAFDVDHCLGDIALRQGQFAQIVERDPFTDPQPVIMPDGERLFVVFARLGIISQVE